MRHLRGERGSSSLELVVLTPALILIVGVLIFAARVALANQAVQSAAYDTARAASLARDAGSARHDATAAGAASMAEHNLHCVTTKVEVDTSGFARPVGTPAKVTATVTCVANLSDISLPFIPGSRSIHAQAVSPLDTYRDRQ